MIKMIFNYYTQDGHLMKDKEFMWRICCSRGEPYQKPEKVYYSSQTGYNNFNPKLNPFAANHLHYYNYDYAVSNLEVLKYDQKNKLI